MLTMFGVMAGSFAKLEHAESARDVVRAVEPRSRGFRVLRFWNDEMLRELGSACDTAIAFARHQSLQP